MVGNRTVYWIVQLGGWLLNAFVLLFYNFLTGGELHPVVLKSITIMTIAGIAISHFYRSIIIRFNWLNLPIHKAVVIVLLCSVGLGGLFHILNSLLSDMFNPEVESFFTQDLSTNLQFITNNILYFFVWSVLYFTTHYFANYKKEEIKNLQMLASQNEIELINLKSQLNPHFMFNALNSIRALVDEDPRLAKTAITQLSAMLRGSLQTGKRQLISLDEELSLVKSYLAIEKIRFEERLKVFYEIDQETLNYNIPPLMIQTLVENAVKHGISSLTQGGELHLQTTLDEGKLNITVRNSGLYKPGKSTSTGIGLKNTERRLGLLYGKDVDISISNQNNQVVSTILIPKNLIYENIDN